MPESTGFFLHASSVDLDGRAVLFIGQSSAGKSTISRLLSAKYPIIADDKVWVFQRVPGEWFVADAIDWLLSERKRGSTGADHSSKKYPVLAIVRIFKSKDLHIHRLPAEETCRFLLDGVFEVDTQRLNTNPDCRKRWFYLLAQFSRDVQGWHLTFRKDASILTLMTDTFRGRK